MKPDSEPNEPEDETPRAEIDPRFLLDIMEALRDTNFLRGWGGPGMYEDFLAWCEQSEEADEIIAAHYAEIPVLVLDEEQSLRVIGLRSQTAAVLMKALLEAFEQQRLRQLLGE